MNAVISGQAGVALLLDGEKVCSLHASRPGEVVDRRSGDIRWLLGEAKDLEFLEGVGLDQVDRHLELASAKADALHLALILLDRTLSHDTRRSAAEELNDLFADEVVTRWAERVLYSHPLPRSADVVGARSACTGRTERVRTFLGRLESRQVVIAQVQQAWEGIPASAFESEEERGYALSVAVKEGLFLDLVEGLSSRESRGAFISRFWADSALRLLPGASEILTNWTSGLPEPQEVQPSPALGLSYVAENRGWDGVGDDLKPQQIGEKRDAQEVLLETPEWEEVEDRSRDRKEDDPLYSMLAEERESSLRRALEDLPPQMRQAVLLRVDRNLKYREIADLMQVSIETVKEHLRQARQHLKRSSR